MIAAMSSSVTELASRPSMVRETEMETAFEVIGARLVGTVGREAEAESATGSASAARSAAASSPPSAAD